MSKNYEKILEGHIYSMVEDILATQNACSVMQKVIIVELEEAKKRVFDKWGLGVAQNAAFVLALDTFKTRELTKFCIVLSMSRISPTVKAADKEALLLDGAEQVAQILQEGFYKDASAYLAKTVNIKNDLMKDVKTALFKAEESL